MISDDSEAPARMQVGDFPNLPQGRTGARKAALSTDNHYNYFVDCLKCEDDDQGFVYHLIQHKAWAGAPAERSELNANWYRGGK